MPDWGAYPIGGSELERAARVARFLSPPCKPTAGEIAAQRELIARRSREDTSSTCSAPEAAGNLNLPVKCPTCGSVLSRPGGNGDLAAWREAQRRAKARAGAAVMRAAARRSAE